MTQNNPNWYQFRQSDRDTVLLGAPAKINLFLRVGGKRPDGFHHIQSLMQAVDMFDELIVTKSNDPGCSLSVVSERVALSAGSDNLVNKAYTSLRAHFSGLPGVEITLKKSIPVEAGLGGGSSDAAATLYGLNQLFELGLSDSRLTELGAGIGADVPFFFSSGTALAEGKGDILRDANTPLDYWLVVAKPAVGLATAEAFRALERQLTVSPEMTTLPVLNDSESFIQWLALLDNDFEEWALTKLPALAALKTALSMTGAEVVRMSGSGSAFFGLFRENPERIVAEAELRDKALKSAQLTICRPIRRLNSGT